MLVVDRNQQGRQHNTQSGLFGIDVSCNSSGLLISTRPWITDKALNIHLISGWSLGGNVFAGIALAQAPQLFD
ncbi:hypothetical protein LX36DRAFT_712697 [Colletotrichum falcatum]|nr:hypothetical protein LX36DRAFT_712697 [Colletotrichum falcatum]